PGRSLPGFYYGLHHLAEQSKLRLVDRSSQFGDALAAIRLDDAAADNIAGINSSVDPMNTAPYWIPVQCCPLGDVHATVERKEAHMRIQGSHGGNRQGVAPQDPRTRVNCQIGLELSDYFS